MTPEKEQYIVKNYYNQKTKDILETLSISKPTLSRILKKYNIKTKTSKIYNFSEDYFKSIDTEEKAYWLGFFYADGCVRMRKLSSESKLKLSIKDINHLEKFKIAINADYKIKRIDNKTVYLSIYSKKFTQNLINKGCNERKTFIVKFPYFLDEKLTRHFIRGYFDGDGSISQSKRKNCKYKYNMLNFVSGSDSMLNSLANIISKECKTKPRKIYNYNNNKFSYISWWLIEDIKSIYDFFYKDSTIYLDRKKEKFEEILNYETNK